jgi:hypothetical protein
MSREEVLLNIFVYTRSVVLISVFALMEYMVL